MSILKLRSAVHVEVKLQAFLIVEDIKVKCSGGKSISVPLERIRQLLSSSHSISLLTERKYSENKVPNPSLATSMTIADLSAKHIIVVRCFYDNGTSS
jgi:hypothetical protein